MFRIILQESNLVPLNVGIQFGMTIRIHGKEIAHPKSQNEDI